MDSETIILSSILDVVYCKRRWYLHMVEQQTDNGTNIALELGRQCHEQVDENAIIRFDDYVILTNFQVYSEQLGLVGLCDEVVFIRDNDGFSVPFVDYKVRVVTVELKHRKTYETNERKAQLCSQVLCLEEMYGCHIDSSYIKYFESDEIVEISMDTWLRRLTLDAIDFVKNYDGCVILPKYGRKCCGCSMFDACRPRETNVLDYVKDLWSIVDE